MDLKSNHTPVLTDSAPITKSRLGVHSSLLPYSPTGAAFPPGLLLQIPRKKTGILDDVRYSSLLDAMKSSSPTAKKITKDINHGFASSDADSAYNSWLVLHTFFNPLCLILVSFCMILDGLLMFHFPFHFNIAA